jgi:hypothetical protein
MIVDMNEWPNSGSPIWVANVRHWVLLSGEMEIRQTGNEADHTGVSR